MNSMLKKMKMPAAKAAKAAPAPEGEEMELMAEEMPAEEASAEAPEASPLADIDDEALMAEVKKRGLKMDGSEDDQASMPVPVTGSY